MTRSAKGMKIIALMLLGMIALVILAFAIYELLGGELSGVAYLGLTVLVGFASWFCWKRPLWGGYLLLAGAIFETAFFAIVLRDAGPGGMVSPIIILILPLMFSGVLLLAAAWVGRKRPDADPGTE